MADQLVTQGLEGLHKRQEGMWEATLIFKYPILQDSRDLLVRI